LQRGLRAPLFLITLAGMNKFLIFGLLPFIWAAQAQAQGAAPAQFFRCESANGVVEYSNMPNSTRDRNCRAMDLPPINTIPAPKLPPAATGRQTGSGGAVPAPQAKASPDGFPKVDAGTQRVRDNDRRRIIEEELKKEEGKLGELRKEFNNGEPERRGDERNFAKYQERVARLKDEIGRGEQNISSLKRELGAIKD
jgi:hypothetical protein